MTTSQRSNPIRRLVNVIAIAIGLMTAGAVPAVYFFAGYTSVSEHLKFRASFDSATVARYIYSREQLWQYQSARLSELLESHRVKNEELFTRLIDDKNAIVVEVGEEAGYWAASRSAPIEVSGKVVGYVQVSVSLASLLVGTSISALLGIGLGLGIFFAVRIIPLRVIDRTFGELQKTNMRFDTALENMPQALCMYDRNHELLVFNRRYAEMYGLNPKSLKPGMTFGEVLKLRAESGCFFEHPYADGDRPRSPIKPWNHEVELNDGRVFQIVRTPMADGGWVSTHEDVTQRRQAQQRIEYLAHHDVLTGLPNRTQFQHHLELSIRQLPRDTSLAVLCLDLDDFKRVNDTLGHPTGDKLLKEVGERLRACLRENDVLARLGGDEFAIIALTESGLTNASALAGRLIEAVSKPFMINHQEIVVGLSVGIAVSPNDSSDPEQLLKASDMALYRAKSAGRSTYRFFEPEMDAQAQARRVLELELRSAISRGELVLHYQPIVEMSTQDIVAFEALVRWAHPLRGLIPPMKFIPLAEETGLIIPLGEWVLRQACSDAAKWSKPVRVAVNLSPVQFKSPRLLESVFAAVRSSGLSPERLELEITESVLLNDNDATLAKLHQLRDFGARISMDDFGTGYSSLSYLRSFPFDKIKIDRSFVEVLGEEDESLAIIRAVTGLGNSLGIATTAEGVETDEQIKLLRREGCSEMQGYYFSPPRPSNEVEGLLAKASRRKAVA